MPAKPARPRASKTTRAALADVIAHLDSLADTRPDDDPGKVATYKRCWGSAPGDVGVTGPKTFPVHACGVEREHREAVSLFLDTWVIAPLRAIAEQLDGTATWETNAYVEMVAKH